MRHSNFAGPTAGALGAVIDKTGFAISPDETRYNLSGIYVHQPAPDTVRLAATDGHRLTYIDPAAPGFTMPKGAILPRKRLSELLSGEQEVTLTITDKGASLTQAGTEIAMRLVEGDFPTTKASCPRSLTPSSASTARR